MDLKILGLNKYESDCYETLVKLGKATAYKISESSGVPYGRIYDVLNSLVSKNLIKIIPEKIKKFVPATPDVLLESLKKKEKELQEIKKELEKAKKIYSETLTEPVEIVKGQRNFYKIIKGIPAAKKYQYSFKFSSEWNPFFVKKTKENIERGVKLKILAKYDENTKENIKKWKKNFPELKIKKFEFDNIAGSIIDDKLVWIALIESNETIIIRDKNFAKLMRKLFELAWK